MWTWIKRISLALAALIVVVTLAFAIGVLWPARSAVPVVTRAPIVIRNVTIIDVAAGTVRPAQSVVIDRDRIVAAGPQVAIPRGAAFIDGRGKYLMPALWDMHTHLFAVAPLLDLPLYVAYGVTNVRDMQGCPAPGDPFIACAEEKRRWGREGEAGLRVAPRVMATSSFMANGPTILERIKNAPRFFGTAAPAEARQFVRHQAGMGVDEIKVYDRIPREAYFALVDEARKLNLPAVGHRPHSVSAIEAAAAGQKSVDHARAFLHDAYPGAAALRQAAERGQWREERRRMLDEHDPRMADAIFRAFVEHGTWYVPTHLTRWVDAYADHDSVRKDPLLRYLHPLMKMQWLEDVNGTIAEDPSADGRRTYREFYAKSLELTGRAHRSGVRILAGTDYIVAGADLHRELQFLVQAGLTPAEALRTATVNPAAYFGVEKDYGSVEAGRKADLVLLGANPLADIRNTGRIEAVVFNGNLYDASAIAGIRRHVERQARSWSVGCKLLWPFLKNPVSY
jgi:imidazolonepropionase-like amidohydrolase